MPHIISYNKAIATPNPYHISMTLAGTHMVPKFGRILIGQ